MCRHKKIIIEPIENEYVCQDCGEYIDNLTPEQEDYILEEALEKWRDTDG